MKHFYRYLLPAIFLMSCQKVLLPHVASNTPVTNFEEMWKGYHQWYGLFEAKKISWDSLYTQYRPLVHEGMGNPELYAVLSQLITPLNDPHVFLQPTSGGLPRYESSVFFRTHKIQQDFSVNVVKANYLPSLVTVDQHLHYGILAGNIGYIHFGAFDLPVSFYRMQLDKIIDALKDTRALVMDIRDHGGGDDQVSRYIAARFATEEKLFMTTRKRNGPGLNDFTAPESWYVRPDAAQRYTHPVALLTTRWTTSAAETFTWAMNTQPQVKQVGDTTAGGFSDVISRELPNGWLYFVSVGDYRNAEGASEEGKGIAPLYYQVNTKEEIAAGKDKVLEAAIALLKQQTDPQ
ncbi:S41 family peptidase [Niabella sp.]|uniref:S41 family peptidase n=1 Tax=Niabella sp. TaxID=1962976 RepID=UPI0026302FFD|nr:S41 family peptidase [Niabella sp.]